MTLPDAARRLIEQRGLERHPEGGWFRETRRAAGTVATPFGPRSRETAIEFLLAGGTVSRLHRLRQDEVWIHREGPGLDLHLFPPGGDHAAHRLAPGSSPVTVPAGVWMGAEATAGGWALVACVCRPGFAYEDLDFAAPQELIAGWPEHAALIARLAP
jgi:predicted cupin superfamily sugar epimerase